jgi:hypothetical protein
MYLLLVLLLPGCGAPPESANTGADAPADTGSCDPSGGTAPYRVTAPPLGGIWTLDLTGEPFSRQLLARTLQGVVNRRAARIYIVDDVDDPRSPEESEEATRHWLSVYTDDYGLSPLGEGTLDDALAAFASEIDGYLLVSEDEPWTFNAAGTEAGTRAAIVATAADAPALEALGIPALDSFVGRWPDAASCYAELASRVGETAYPGFGVLRTTKVSSRDFFVEQGVVELGGLPGEPEWTAVEDALTTVPPEVAVYGYAAEDGIQELNSVTAFSAAGDVLVPSDSAPNLSFHMAVAPAAITRPPAPADADLDCDAAELNVVIGLSDGDNQVVETALYPTSRYWLSPDRGRIPIAWSMSPALATLAPAVIDYYTRTVAPSDELVVMIGAGYAYGSALPDPDWFFGLTIDQMETLGLHVLWLFDPVESGSGDYSWQPTVEAALACGKVDGVLDGYYPPLFHDAPGDETVGTVPLMRASGAYDDGPDDIADRIRDVLAVPRADRPRVVFYSAAAWTNDVPGLVAALTPLEADGVRFVSASAGMRCVEP